MFYGNLHRPKRDYEINEARNRLYRSIEGTIERYNEDINKTKDYERKDKLRSVVKDLEDILDEVGNDTIQMSDRDVEIARNKYHEILRKNW